MQVESLSGDAREAAEQAASAEFEQLVKPGLEERLKRTYLSES